jgi:hypothetical protein
VRWGGVAESSAGAGRDRPLPGTMPIATAGVDATMLIAAAGVDGTRLIAATGADGTRLIAATGVDGTTFIAAAGVDGAMSIAAPGVSGPAMETTARCHLAAFFRQRSRALRSESACSVRARILSKRVA